MRSHRSDMMTTTRHLSGMTHTLVRLCETHVMGTFVITVLGVVGALVSLYTLCLRWVTL